MRAYFLVALVMCAPAYAQSADAPIAALDQPLPSCQPGDVVLKPDAAIAAAKRLASAEAKVAVYDKTPILPWWGVVIIGVVAAGAGVGITVAAYEAGRKQP